MTTFDDKEKAAENKYAHDKEQEFKVHARAHKLLGLWAAGKMGLSGAQAEEYAALIVTVDMAKANPQHLFKKIKNDLFDKNVHISDHDIHAEIHRLEELAKQQVHGG
jgi:hypothetical protein